MQFDLKCLPDKFHEQVVGLEMQIEGREYKEDEQALVVMISKLMGLYSVNPFSSCRQLLNFTTARPMKSSSPTTSKNSAN